jgi:hypothetical protein
VQRITEKTDTTTTVALLARWNHVATQGLGEVDAASLGKAEAEPEQRRYYTESAAVTNAEIAARDTRINIWVVLLRI